MTRTTLFSSPLLLGFEHFERTLERIAKAAPEGYPPYNVEQVGEDGLRLTVAVAGFAVEDLEVLVEDGQLAIRGKQRDEEDRVYLHRGIAARQFQRRFVLADGLEVVGASLDAGLLSIDLKRPEPAATVRRVRIATGPGRAQDPRRVGEAGVRVVELGRKD